MCAYIYYLFFQSIKMVDIVMLLRIHALNIQVVHTLFVFNWCLLTFKLTKKINADKMSSFANSPWSTVYIKVYNSTVIQSYISLSSKLERFSLERQLQYFYLNMSKLLRSYGGI